MADLLGSEGPSTKVKESDRSMLHCSLQNTLQLLESLPELSTQARLLRCQASILLADVSCVQGGATWGDMVQVFQGLVTMVKTQVQLSSTLCTSSTSSAWEREGRRSRERAGGVERAGRSRERAGGVERGQGE